MENNSDENIKIIQTDIDAKDGHNKCPGCSATDISLNIKTGKLRCNFCKTEFEPEKLEGLESDITNLKGVIMGSGMQDIENDAQDMVTIKCDGCGAEIVIDTKQSTRGKMPLV